MVGISWAGLIRQLLPSQRRCLHFELKYNPEASQTALRWYGTYLDMEKQANCVHFTAMTMLSVCVMLFLAIISLQIRVGICLRGVEANLRRLLKATTH